MPHRVEKVSAQVRTEVSQILSELRDPRLGLVSVIDVEMSADLRIARVRVSRLGDDAEHAGMMAALEKARGWVRRELAHRLNNLRRVPELVFVDDRNTEYAVHIHQVLDEIMPAQKAADAT